MRKLCFATNNANKIAEVAQLLGNQYDLQGLNDFGITEELPETQSTIEGNSQQKAEYVFERYQIPVFADDTGLEVDALNGEPGVYSARYAGPTKDGVANMQKVLAGLQGQENRGAQFRTVVTLFLPSGAMHQFEGIARGRLIEAPVGQGGFGYDPIFIPEGYDKTFAEMEAAEKNAISHRGIAVRKLIDFLRATEW
ncbi:MAG: RdgB/HAM1 family non-canonical purine NTP pyrophosphatase [Bacteroidota bacterium]